MKRFLAMILALMLLAVPLAQAAEYTDQATVKKVQQALNDKGYDCGTPDGVSGNKTKGAIRQYQADNGLEATGAIDDALYESLGLYEAREAAIDFDARLPKLDREYCEGQPYVWAGCAFYTAMLKLVDAGTLDADPVASTYPLKKNTNGAFPLVFANKGEGQKLTDSRFSLGPGRYMIVWEETGASYTDEKVEAFRCFLLYKESLDGSLRYNNAKGTTSEALEEAVDRSRLTWDIDACDYIIVFGGYKSLADEDYYMGGINRYGMTMLVFVIDARELTCLHIESVSTDLPGSPTDHTTGYLDRESAEEYIAELLAR